MQAVATPRPENRAAFANQLAEVRAMDAKNEYTNQLNEMEVEYQFILLRSLDLFHKEMLRTKLPERLHTIEEKLCDTAVYPAYHTNLPCTSWNWNIKICRHCHKNSLKPILTSNELCCENCGLLEPLDGVSFDVNEIYRCGDYKVVKHRRSTRRYNFRHYLEKHVKLLSENGHTLSCETIVKANEFFFDAVGGLPDLGADRAVGRREVHSELLLAASSTRLCNETCREVGANASTVRCCVSSDPTSLESARAIRFFIQPLLQFTKTHMPVQIEFWGDGFPTTPAYLREVGEGKLKGLPKIMRFDGITHILHSGLMKFHCRLQLRGLMKYADNLAIEKVVKNVSKGGVQNHGHGYTQGCRLFSWLCLPL